MSVFLVIIAIGIMAGIIYMALSKKSTLMMKITALAALALMVAAVIVCIVIFVKYDSTPKQLLLPDMLPSELPPEAPQQNTMMTVLFVIFLIGVFVIVTIKVLKEQGKGLIKKKEPEFNDFDDEF